jgi:hypothetical protein
VLACVAVADGDHCWSCDVWWESGGVGATGAGCGDWHCCESRARMLEVRREGGIDLEVARVCPVHKVYLEGTRREG